MGEKIFIPQMGADLTNVEVGKIHKKVGDVVKTGDLLFEIVTDKATFDVEADDNGVILALHCNEGDKFQVLDEVGYIGAKGDDIPELKTHNKIIPKNPKSPQKAKDDENTDNLSQGFMKSKVKVTPKAKKLAKKNGLVIDDIFKDADRIIKEADVIEYLDE